MIRDIETLSLLLRTDLKTSLSLHPYIQASVQALYYFLLGPRIPSATFLIEANVDAHSASLIRFHPYQFQIFKVQLQNQQIDGGYGRIERCSLLNNLKHLMQTDVTLDSSPQVCVSININLYQRWDTDLILSPLAFRL